MEAPNYVLGKRLWVYQATVWMFIESEWRKHPVCFNCLFDLMQLLLWVPEPLESLRGDREHKVQGQKMQVVQTVGRQMKGFKGVEGNEGGKRNRSNGKGKVLGKPGWGIFSFPKKPLKYHTILSKIMPTRKQNSQQVQDRTFSWEALTGAARPRSKSQQSSQSSRGKTLHRSQNKFSLEKEPGRIF